MARLSFRDPLKGGEKTRKKQSSGGSPDVCAQCGQALRSKEPVRLRELDIAAGKLYDIIEPDGEDIALAKIADWLVEVPAEIVADLQKLMGQMIFLARVSGKYRIGAQT